MQNGTDNIYLIVLLGVAGSCVLSAAIILFYFRYQKKFYRQREEMKDAALNFQVQLLHNTIQSQENERKRIGKDLHDEVGGGLAGLRVSIGKLCLENQSEAATKW